VPFEGGTQHDHKPGGTYYMRLTKKKNEQFITFKVIMEYSTICRLFISPEAGCFLTIQVEK
jgi:hypothetical protein